MGDSYINRSGVFNYVEERLNILSVRVDSRGKLNILDLHLHSENFYLHLLNQVYAWSLENINSESQNVEAIDLIDHINKTIIQVSATNTKQKIELALEKDVFMRFPGYSFKFISISKNADELRKKKYKNFQAVQFEPSEDIIDIASILQTIISFEIDKQNEVYELIKKELGSEVDTIKFDSDLATIIGDMQFKKE